MSYSAESSYRYAVRPLAVIMMLGGVVVLLMFTAFQARITWCPFVDSDVAQRAIVATLAGVQSVLGLGLWLRSRLAWQMLFVLICLASAWTVAGAILDPPFDHAPSLLFALFCLVTNTAWAVLLWIVTRPAFHPSAR
jgi:hypothetical protein